MIKRGNQMTIGAIMTIIISIVVLVFLIYGFSTGWGNLWDKVTNLGGGEINIDTVATTCLLACVEEKERSFCAEKREIISEKGSEGYYSCEIWATSGKFGIKGCDDLCPVAKTTAHISGVLK